MAFAASLTKIVAGKKAEIGDRQKYADMWKACEEKLLGDAVELFKDKCTREAEQQKCETTASFEVITRDIKNFPKRVLKDATYYVETWPDGVTSECWFYGARGLQASYSAGAPILFAEVLQAMLPKFLERIKDLGFAEFRHEAGTWKVYVRWADPDESEKKKRRRDRD
eukprot:TRINITY_DN7965_c0_g1_i1.p1 TRINITY_DN7965_c0_g1~~TRINITY_DN7965_c0_g1_i1.p1  ORF type:complete len:190 (+),score=32.85 TRINITY_DN7965_c0_g1_i1:68-571(+)